MAISTQTAWKRLTDELERRFGPSEPQVDTEDRLRHVWRKVPSGADWMVLCSSRHFDFRENILESIKQNDNSAYAVLCGIKHDEWCVYMTDLVPLISKVLERQERRVPQPDGSIYYELDYEISNSGEMCLTTYRDVELAELPELSELVNRA